jgi:large subunit ribosomal protein L11
MAKEMRISSMVEGGKASAGPPLGPALGPMGVNIGDVINQINEKTKEFAGMKIPVIVYVDPSSKEFRIEVGSPPLAELVKKELKLEKFPGHQANEKINIPLAAVVKITKMKREGLNAKNFKDAVKTILGSCVSYGLLIDQRDPREVQKDIDDGKLDPESIKTEGVEFTTEKIILKEEVVEEEEAPAEGEEKEGEEKPEEGKPEEKGKGKEEKGKKEEGAPAEKGKEGEEKGKGKEEKGKKEEKKGKKKGKDKKK